MGAGLLFRGFVFNDSVAAADITQVRSVFRILFFHPRHTIICQRHVTLYHKISPHEKGVQTIHGHKYVSTKNPCPVRIQAYENKT
jgi:hypothetical protein